MNKIKINKKFFLLVPIVIVCVLTFFVETKEEPKIVIEPNIIKEEQVLSEKLSVDIKGAVKKPGVYELEVGTRVIDAINKSGGLLKDANTKLINLSKLLVDQMVITVYKNSDLETEKELVVEYVEIEKECLCEIVKNDACIDQDTDEQKLVSLNNASKEELEKLPGIGGTKADAIIAYRLITPFKTIEELKNVTGIGEATYLNVKDFITI